MAALIEISIIEGGANTRPCPGGSTKRTPGRETGGRVAWCAALPKALRPTRAARLLAASFEKKDLEAVPFAFKGYGNPDGSRTHDANVANDIGRRQAGQYHDLAR